MSVPGELHALVERFDRGRDSYRSRRFNEAQTRVDFINPLLGLLGGDVENRQGRPEAYRDVVYEDRVKGGGGTKAPDYGFYAGGRHRFFLEAKKPSVHIAGDVAPAVLLHSPVFSGGYYKFSAPYLKKLPVRTIDFSHPEDVARHDRMVGLVERMLGLHERLAGARIWRERAAVSTCGTRGEHGADPCTRTDHHPERHASIREVEHRRRYPGHVRWRVDEPGG